MLRWLDGKDLYEDGEIRAARRMFSDALDLFPDLVRALLDRAACCYRIALEEVGARACRGGGRALPQGADAAARPAQDKPSFFSYAIRDYNRALRVSPDAVVYTMRGSAFLDLGHPRHAVSDFNRALKLHPSFALAVYRRGTARVQQQRREEAAQDFARAVDLAASAIRAARARGEQPSTRIVAVLAEALRDRGVAHYEAEALPEAVADAGRALRVRPDFVDALINRGAALLRGGEVSGALADFDRATRLDPDYAVPWKNRGNVLMVLGAGGSRTGAGREAPPPRSPRRPGTQGTSERRWPATPRPSSWMASTWRRTRAGRRRQRRRATCSRLSPTTRGRSICARTITPSTTAGAASSRTWATSSEPSRTT